MHKVKLYDESAPTYHRRYRQIQGMKYQTIVPFLLKGPIVDVGFGTGIGLPSMVEFSPVIGVDGAIEMLRYATEQIKKMKLGKHLVSLVCGLVEALPFRNCSVPTVISVTMIQNLTNINQGIDELIRILQKDGICGITSLAKVLPLNKLKSKINARFRLITHLENLAAEDDGLVFQLS